MASKMTAMHHQSLVLRVCNTRLSGGNVRGVMALFFTDVTMMSGLENR